MERNAGIDRKILQAASPRGLVTYATLRSLGLAPATITDRGRAGKLIRVHQGVYFVGHAEQTPLARAEAAVLACGARAALSHDSAAALYKLRRWPPAPEISCALRHDRPGIHAHRTRTLTRADVTVRDGIQVTVPARTIADIAPRLTDVQLTRAIHEARRNGDLTASGLARLYARCPRAARLVDPGEPPSESALDDAFRAFLRRYRLPRPDFQVEWQGFRLDGLYPRQKLIVELDGGDHAQPDRFESDRRRDARSLELGYATVRITWRRLHEQPRQLAGQLRAILAAREPSAGQS